MKDVYSILNVLGKGNFGQVRKATHKETGVQGAIKIIKKSLLNRNRDYAHLMQNELSVLGEVSHPNIVATYDLLEDEKFFFIFSEVARYGDLSKYLERRSDTEQAPMSEDEVKTIARQILYALSHLHARGIVHRDVKLENILIDSVENNKLNVKLTDFGFAERMSEDGRLKGVVGSKHYIAPEILDGNHYDTKVDVWSFMVCIYALFT